MSYDLVKDCPFDVLTLRLPEAQTLTHDLTVTPFLPYLMPKSPPQRTTSSRITRASTQLSPSKPDKRARQKARCNVCEGRPLRIECEHTVTGRLHLFTLKNAAPENENIIQNEELAPEVSQSTNPKSPDKAPGRCSKCSGRPLRSQCCHTKAGRLFLHEQSVLEELQELPTLHHMPQTANVPLGIAPISDSVIDPALRRQPPSRPLPVQPEAQSPVQPELDSPMHRAFSSTSNLNANTDIETPSSSSVRALNNSIRRARASAANPSFGHVEGVHRGEAPHSIHRGHALPQRIVDRDKCQKQFLETANSIITRCEDLSAQTGCWLFIGIQHATARGAPIHYASPRIRRDAPDAISDFASEFCTMMNDVMDVRRRDTFEVQRNLHAIELEKESMERELALLRSKEVDREARLNQYKNLFGTLDM